MLMVLAEINARHVIRSSMPISSSIQSASMFNIRLDLFLNSVSISDCIFTITQIHQGLHGQAGAPKLEAHVHQARCAPAPSGAVGRVLIHQWLGQQRRGMAITSQAHSAQACQEITRAWFKKGLDPRSITRDLRWGTPVPVPGYENKARVV